MRRHDAVLRVLQQVALTTLGDPYNARSTVTWQPVIRSQSEAADINARLANDQRRVKALEGDLGIRGLIPLGSGVIMIDGRCTHPEGVAAGEKLTSVLVAEAEEEKRKRYRSGCQARGHTCVPFVWTTGGVLGKSAMRLIDKMAARLGEKWNRPKGRCKGWIKVQVAIAIARATSACIRNVRGGLPQAAYDHPAFDGAAIAGGVARL